MDECCGHQIQNNHRNLLNKYYLEISTICSISPMYNCVCVLKWSPTLFGMISDTIIGRYLSNKQFPSLARFDTGNFISILSFALNKYFLWCACYKQWIFIFCEDRDSSGACRLVDLPHGRPKVLWQRTTHVIGWFAGRTSKIKKIFEQFFVIFSLIIIIIIFLHGLGRLTCSGIDALPSFPGASTISSSSRFVVEGVFRESGVVHSFKVIFVT